MFGRQVLYWQSQVHLHASIFQIVGRLIPHSQVQARLFDLLSRLFDKQAPYLQS